MIACASVIGGGINQFLKMNLKDLESWLKMIESFHNKSGAQ